MENENQVTNEVNEEPMVDEEMATDTSDLDNGNSEEEAEAFGDEARKHRQSAKENAKQAEKRRARESMSMTERDEIILETLGRKNPFTGGDMADSEDVEEYLLQKEISEKGGDPVGDLAAYRKQKAREKRAAEASEVEGKQRMATELNEFREKFPNVNVQELLRDEDFAEYADGKLGRKTISAVYEAYVNYKNKLTGKQTEAKEEAKAAQANANKKASVGSLHSSHKESKDFFTPDQVRAMTKEEVHANYENIMKSMKKWK